MSFGDDLDISCFFFNKRFDFFEDICWYLVDCITVDCITFLTIFNLLYLEDDEEEGIILVDDEEEEMILVDEVEGMICFFEGKIS